MWELDYKESWASKNWCFWTVVLEKTLESPLDCKEIQPVHPKGNQSWIFIGRTDAETPILRPPDVKNWLIGKDPDAGKDWRQGEKGTTEFEMASLTQWTRVWVNSRTWWLTGRPGVLQSMMLQRVGHDWGTEMNWTELNWSEEWTDYHSGMGVSECICLPFYLLLIFLWTNYFIKTSQSSFWEITICQLREIVCSWSQVVASDTPS